MVDLERPYVLAVDIGTTSTKTLIVDRKGAVHAAHSVEYPLYTPKPDRAEQDPEQIYRAVLKGIRTVLEKKGLSGKDILCVSFSSAMHSLLAVDRNHRPLTNCITFADNRSTEYVRLLREKYDGHRIYLNTGTPIHPMSPLLKLMWMKDHEPEVFATAYKFIGIKEYVFARLFGTYVVDYSIASATGLFNLESLAWDEQALAAADITPERLSEPVNTTHIVTGMNAEAVRETGLLADTPFVVGASDGVLANLGIGAIDPGVYAVTIGTSGAVRGVVRKPVTDPEGRLFCYALHQDYWVIGGAINNGGIMLRWVRDQLATLEAKQAADMGEDAYDYFSRLADEVPAGSDGLIFLPLLAGERAPYWNADARGVFFGLNLYHQKKHMIRAVMEGVMYRIRSVTEALTDVTGQKPREMRASGGFARSLMWRQMMADVLATDVSIPESIESSGTGAAKLGLLAVGAIKDLGETSGWVKTVDTHRPRAQESSVYERLYPIYMDVYHRLREPFRKIAAFQREQG